MILARYNTPLIIILILGSLINLFFYLNIIINMVINNQNINYSPKGDMKSVPALIIISSATSMGLAPIVILYAMTLFYKSQRHWDSILYLGNLSRNNWCGYKTPYSNRAQTAGILSRKRSAIQYNCDSPRIPHNLLSSYTRIHRGVWKLTTTTHTRNTGYSISTPKQHEILTITTITNLTGLFCRSREGGGNRVDSISSPSKKYRSCGAISRPSNFLTPLSWGVLNFGGH